MSSKTISNDPIKDLVNLNVKKRINHSDDEDYDRGKVA